MSAKSEPQPLDVIQGRRQVGVIFKVAPSGMGGRGGWAFKNMESGRLFTFARLQEAKDEAWKSFAGCIFKRQKPLARLAPYARGTVAGPREENPEPSKEESGIAAERAKNPSGFYVLLIRRDGDPNYQEKIVVRTLAEAKREVAARGAGAHGLTADGYVIRDGKAKRAKNPLPDPANIIASSVIGSVARFVTDKVLRGNSAPATVIEQREENPMKKPAKLYTDHRGLAFRIYPAGDKVPPLNRWMNFAGDSYQWIARDNRTEDRPSDMRSFYIDPMTDQRGKVVGWSMREWDSRNGGHRPVLSFKTKTDALKHVREIMGTGRATNPAELSAKAIPAGKILLVLVGHPGGLGYYTGQTWDTVKSKAIRFDSVAGAKEAAKRLGPFLPGNAHIEVWSE